MISIWVKANTSGVKVSSTELHAIFTGRFQPFHSGHLKKVQQIAEHQSNRLVIGVCVFWTDIPEWRWKAPPAEDEDLLKDAMRQDKNPLGYVERSLMIGAAMRSSLPDVMFRIVPIIRPLRIWWDVAEPLLPEKRIWIVPNDNPKWTNVKIRELTDLGETAVRFYSTDLSFNNTASDIRRLIRSDDNAWRNLVPSACVKILEQAGGLERIRNTV